MRCQSDEGLEHQALQERKAPCAWGAANSFARLAAGLAGRTQEQLLMLLLVLLLLVLVPSRPRLQPSTPAWPEAVRVTSGPASCASTAASTLQTGGNGVRSEKPKTEEAGVPSIPPPTFWVCNMRTPRTPGCVPQPPHEP